MQQMEKTGLSQIYRCLQQKYQQLDGIVNATKELDALSGGEDPDAFGLYLDIRHNHIKCIEKIDTQMEQEISKLDASEARLVRACLAQKADGLPAALSKLAEADRQNRALHTRAVRLDRALFNRVRNPVP